MQNKAFVFYVPIGAETYIPMTPENIEAHYVKRATIAVSDVTLQQIVEHVNHAGHGQFNDQAVRVKILFPDQHVILIDNFGGVRQKAGERQLSAPSLARIKVMLEEITIVRTK